MSFISKKNTGVIIFVLALISIGTLIGVGWPTIEVNPELSSEAYDILLKYFFIILVTERSLAVYNAIRFEGPKNSLKRKIKYYKTKREEYEDLECPDREQYIDRDPQFLKRREEHIGESIQVIYTNLMELRTKDLEEIENKMRQFSMRALLVFGVIFAVAGLSILSDLLNISRNWYSNATLFQAGIMKFIDILITGALIGGGSKSFHELLSTIQSVLDNVKTKHSG